MGSVVVLELRVACARTDHPPICRPLALGLRFDIAAGGREVGRTGYRTRFRDVLGPNAPKPGQNPVRNERKGAEERRVSVENKPPYPRADLCPDLRSCCLSPPPLKRDLNLRFRYPFIPEADQLFPCFECLPFLP